jgi:hypothetical protein
MPKHMLSYIANAALFALLVSDHKVNTRNKAKYKMVVEQNDLLRDRLQAQSSQVDYLVDMITRNNIDVTEFDLIALRSLIPTEEA